MPLARHLAIAATVCDAFLFGTGLDRAGVEMPAWHHIGPIAWAAYSRHADLGNGLYLYPTAAIAGTVLSIAALVAWDRSTERVQSARLPLILGVVFTLAGMLLSTQAAPIMLSLRRVGDDPAVLQRAFDGFEFWGTLRTIAQSLAFVANLASVSALGGPRTLPDSKVR